MSYKIKISQPGKDVKTCSDDELVYSSDWDSLKIKTISQVDHTLGTTATPGNPFGEIDDTITIAHGCGYPPAFFVVANGGQSVWTPLPYFWTYYADLYIKLFNRIFGMTAWVDSTNLYINIGAQAGGSSFNINFKYYVFYNQLD